MEREEKIHQAQDKLLKISLGEKQNAIEFCSAYLPERVKKFVLLNTLERQESRYYSRNLEAFETDVLYKVDFVDGKQGFIYYLLENQSRPDRFMRLRLLNYISEISRDYLSKNPRTKTLALIIPVVFFHGPGTWNYSLEFEELIDLDIVLRAVETPGNLKTLGLC